VRTVYFVLGAGNSVLSFPSALIRAGGGWSHDFMWKNRLVTLASVPDPQASCGHVWLHIIKDYRFPSCKF